MHPILLRVALLCLAATSTFAQGTKADYERAASLAKRTDGKVFRARVEPHWLPGGDSFWYRIEIAPGKFENVFVDCVKGERRTGYEVPADAAKPAALAAPHPSGPSDVESSITFINKTAANVVCWWIGTDGKPRRYATVKPGESFRQHTFAGHVWVVENEARERLGVFEAHEGGGEVVIEGSR